MTFDFSKRYNEDIIIHEQCGGGSASISLLNRIIIVSEIIPVIEQTIKRIGSDYVAVHVRNTDRQTKYEVLFKELYPKVTGKVLLVCSDDAEVIINAKSFFDSSLVITSSNIPHKNKTPLHRSSTYSNEKQRRKATINSIVDLIALGNANELYYMDTTARGPSGYSRLAMHLFRNKDIINDLLGRRLATIP